MSDVFQSQAVQSALQTIGLSSGGNPLWSPLSQAQWLSIYGAGGSSSQPNQYGQYLGTGAEVLGQAFQIAAGSAPLREHEVAPQFLAAANDFLFKWFAAGPNDALKLDSPNYDPQAGRLPTATATPSWLLPVAAVGGAYLLWRALA